MATLADIANQLQDNNKSQEETRDAITQLNQTLSDYFLQIQRNALDEQERRRQESQESRRDRPRPSFENAFTRGISQGADLFNIPGAAAFGAIAGLAGRAVGLLIAPFRLIGALIPSIQTLAKLVKVGGPVAAVITLLYESLKNIGERPEFQAAIQGINDLWSNTIIPTWNHILETFEQLKESFNLWKGTEEGQATIQMFVDWWNNIDTAIENFVINQLSTVTETLNGIFDGINLLLDGEWSAGLSTIINSALIFVQDTADNMITAIANLFGIDFGADGTFLGFVNRKWAELQVTIKETWEGLTTFVSDKWNSVKTWFLDTLAWAQEGIATGWTNLTTFVTEKWNSIKLWFTDTLAWAQEGIATGWTNLTTFVSEKWNSIKSWFTNEQGTGVLDFTFPSADQIQVIFDQTVENVKAWFRDLFDFLPSIEEIKQQLSDLVPDFLKPDPTNTQNLGSVGDLEFGGLPGYEQGSFLATPAPAPIAVVGGAGSGRLQAVTRSQVVADTLTELANSDRTNRFGGPAISNVLTDARQTTVVSSSTARINVTPDSHNTAWMMRRGVIPYGR